MKGFALLLAFLMLLPPATLQAEGKFTTIFNRGTWTVFQFAGDAQGGMPSYCGARSGTKTEFFELIGTETTFCISGEASHWRFRKRKAEVGFFVGSSGFFLNPGTYFSNGFQYCDKREVVELMVDSLTLAQSELGGKTIDFYDHRRRKVGGFPAPGMKQAVRKWKSCIDSL